MKLKYTWVVWIKMNSDADKYLNSSRWYFRLPHVNVLCKRAIRLWMNHDTHFNCKKVKYTCLQSSLIYRSVEVVFSVLDYPYDVGSAIYCWINAPGKSRALKQCVLIFIKSFHRSLHWNCNAHVYYKCENRFWPLSNNHIASDWKMNIEHFDKTVR